MRKSRIPPLLVALLLAVPALAVDPPAPEWLARHNGDDGQQLLNSTGLSVDRQAEILGEWTHQNSPEPRAGARLWGSPEQWEGPQTLIAEWDQELYPDGAGVVSTQSPLGLAPYALLPLGNRGKVWRSVSLPPVGSMQGGAAVFTADRVDYTDTEFRVWLYLAGPAGTVHSVMIEHPRTVTP